MAKYSLSDKKHAFIAGLFLVLCDGEPTDAYAAANVIFSDRCIIHGGVFHGGEFYGGEFYGGEFYDGVFHGGVFHGGVFHGGKFYDGFLQIQIQGSRHCVNSPDGKTIQIGCKNGTPDWWAENYAEVGACEYYTADQICEYKAYIDLLSAMILTNKEGTQ